MAPHPAHFVHFGCASPLFCDSYTRNNKSTGHKNLRCFPHCCGTHRPNSFCGASIVVECLVQRPTRAIVSYCRFEASDMAEQVIQVDESVPTETLMAEVKSTDVPLGPWMAGDRLDVPSTDIIRFEYNRVRQSWHYGWRSNRFNCNIKHTFVVYVFEQHPGTLRCISRVASPPFTICSTRRSIAKLPSSPGGGPSDDDIKPESSPQRKRSRTVKSPAPTQNGTLSLPTNHDDQNDDIETAMDEMLQLADIYARSGVVVDKANHERLDIAPASPTYTLLLELLERHLFTRVTLEFVQRRLDQVDVSLHDSFRQLVWFLWNQVSHALDAHQLTVRDLIELVQRDFPLCEFARDYDAWIHHYTTVATELKKTTMLRDIPAPFASKDRRPIFGRWQRETPARHCQLVQQHLLERGSRIWTCFEGCDSSPTTVQMRWECAVYAPWTTFRLDQLPQSHPHQLLGPSGLPTLGSGMHLCGTRAWEENHG
ncbi:hypothetical protein, variant 1 [Aphanomyces invadans]|nr:hypothetical protein, variant 1 [Aphanomyces invadans]ETW03401.1 hypothetical protein, variant 1 [Aphanomyces invadans]|eukprot:XP_008867630.1 hypothetical protein, variant 1 [Aphanomyces invadans]